MNGKISQILLRYYEILLSLTHQAEEKFIWYTRLHLLVCESIGASECTIIFRSCDRQPHRTQLKYSNTKKPLVVSALTDTHIFTFSRIQVRSFCLVNIYGNLSSVTPMDIKRKLIMILIIMNNYLRAPPSYTVFFNYQVKQQEQQNFAAGNYNCINTKGIFFFFFNIHLLHKLYAISFSVV